MKILMAVIVMLVMTSTVAADEDVDRVMEWLARNSRDKQVQAASAVQGVQARDQTDAVASQDEDIKKAMAWLNSQQSDVVSAESGRTMTSPVSHGQAANDKFDLFVIAGGWQTSGNKDDPAGQFAQAKVRYRPFSYSLFGQETGFGGFAVGEVGSGESGKSDFNWTKVAVGPSQKVYGRGWDNVTDLGWARQWDQGKNDKQTTDLVYLSNYTNIEQRRQAGSELLPQTEIFLSANVPYSANRVSARSGKTFGRSLEARDLFTAEADVRQSIYDFNLQNNFRLTPGLFFGGGVEAKSAVGKIGPSVKLSSYNQDILIVDLFAKVKAGVQGFRVQPNIFLGIEGVRKAVKSSRITEPRPEDLEFRPEEIK